MALPQYLKLTTWRDLSRCPSRSLPHPMTAEALSAMRAYFRVNYQASDPPSSKFNTFLTTLTSISTTFVFPKAANLVLVTMHICLVSLSVLMRFDEVQVTCKQPSTVPSTYISCQSEMFWQIPHSRWFNLPGILTAAFSEDHPAHCERSQCPWWSVSFLSLQRLSRLWSPLRYTFWGFRFCLTSRREATKFIKGRDKRIFLTLPSIHQTLYLVHLVLENG